MPKPSGTKPATGSKKPTPPLYVHGPFALVKREDRNNLEIIWYDPAKGREVSKSAKTPDLELGKLALHRHHQEVMGGPANCEHCGQPMPKANGVVLDILRDYWLGKGEGQISGKAIQHRLAHVKRYITEVLGQPELRTRALDEKWIGRFRDWLAAEPVLVGDHNGGNVRPRDKPRSPSTVEHSIVQLHAALKFCGEKPAFVPQQMSEMSRAPEYRADVETLAKMFRYCLYPDAKSPAHRARLARDRAGILAFLRLSIATWGRPDAVMEASTAPETKQWSSASRTFDLNPVGRRQTHKVRPCVPVPECIGQWLDTINGRIVPGLSKSTWKQMAEALGLPQDGESGMKLLRRSIAQLARPIITESHWVQGRYMMGHEKVRMSDKYAFRDPAYFGVALDATTRLCDQIDALCPGAFRVHPDGPEADNVITLGARKAA